MPGCSCTPVRAGWATGWRPSTSRSRAICARRWWIQLPDADLAYLPERTPEFWAYIRDLRWAQHFALLNREEMMARVVDCAASWLGQDVVATETVNCHHNYTAQEVHFGKKVWVSRKGAIDASAGTARPHSRLHGHAVVRGVGEGLRTGRPELSAPWRRAAMYSRAAARKKFSRAELDAAMAGIEWRRTDAFLDEIPAAYKEIDQVMADASELGRDPAHVAPDRERQGRLRAPTVAPTAGLAERTIAHQCNAKAGLATLGQARLGCWLLAVVTRRESALRDAPPGSCAGHGARSRAM